MRLDYLFYNYLYKPILKRYLKHRVNTRVDGYKITVLPGVFHPKLFFSTNYFYKFIQRLDLQNKIFLEIGCGSGLLSMLALKKGAMVTALDIDKKAIENTILNFETNFKAQKLPIIIKSDVFEGLTKQAFDIIIINPPYFFKAVENQSQYAWNCGLNGEFFVKLFSSIKDYSHPKTAIFMILADNCDIERIKNLASQNKLSLILLEEKLIRWEKNYIYQIQIGNY